MADAAAKSAAPKGGSKEASARQAAAQRKPLSRDETLLLLAGSSPEMRKSARRQLLMKILIVLAVLKALSMLWTIIRGGGSAGYTTGKGNLEESNRLGVLDIFMPSAAPLVRKMGEKFVDLRRDLAEERLVQREDMASLEEDGAGNDIAKDKKKRERVAQKELKDAVAGDGPSEGDSVDAAEVEFLEPAVDKVGAAAAGGA